MYRESGRFVQVISHYGILSDGGRKIFKNHLLYIDFKGISFSQSSWGKTTKNWIVESEVSSLLVIPLRRPMMRKDSM